MLEKQKENRISDVQKRANNRDTLTRYGKTTVFDSFAYIFTDGIYGLLDSNGVGKSTLMNIMPQNLKPTQGIVLANVKNTAESVKEYKNLLGFMMQQQSLYSAFTLTRFLLHGWS